LLAGSVPGSANALFAAVNSNDGRGVYGESAGGSGVRGKSGSANGVYGTSDTGNGVRGEHSGSGNYGYLGSQDYGVYGSGNNVGVKGVSSINTGGIGVDGFSSYYVGVRGSSTSSTGVEGISVTGTGVYGTSGPGWGVWGYSTNSAGVAGSHPSGNLGSLGSSQTGVYGYCPGGSGVNYAIKGKTNSPTGYGGYFEGGGYFSGNVGIGTENPEYKLDVRGDIKVGGPWDGPDADSPFIRGVMASNDRFYIYGKSDGINNGSLIIGTGDDGTEPIVFAQGNPPGTERMRIASNGNVGIGTNSPSAKLNVVGTTAIGSSSNVANGTYAIALGEGCGAAAAVSIAIGVEAQTSAAHAISIGKGAHADNLGAISIGYYTASSGFYSMALGSHINAAGNRSFGIGLDDTPRNIYASNVMAIMGGNVGIGTTSPGNILTIAQDSATDPVADAWTVYSSRRLKTHIAPLESSLENVQKLQGVSFDWKANGKHDIGLIAEDVGQVIPEVVEYEENGVDAKSVDYARLVSVLIEAMKEQQKEIDALKRRLAVLEAE